MAPQRRQPAWRPHRPARNEPPSASPGARRAVRTVHRIRSTAPGVREEGHMAVLQDTVKTGISKTQVKAEPAITSSPKRLARIAGLLYLVVGVFGGFAVAYVSPMLYVPGDAAATVGKVLANADLVRIGVLADLLQATVFVFLAMTLYLLLSRVHRNAATAMVVIVAIATTIMCLDKVFQFAALRVATDPSYAAAFGIAGPNALVLLLLDIHHYGDPIAQNFFGFGPFSLGYPSYRLRGVSTAPRVVLRVAGPSLLGEQ